MSEYKETLARFQKYMLDQDAAMEDHVAGDDIEFKRMRLGVYHEGYSLRLLDILGKTFPAVKALLGEELFEKIGRAYITAHPSNHYSVGLIGRHFSRFLSEYPDAEPIWAELAAFEWALDLVVEAADAPYVTFDEMAAALKPEDWANLQLKAHPTLTTLPLFYAVPGLRHHLLEGKEKPDLTRKDEPEHWLIWRYNYKAHFCSTTKEEFVMFKLIQGGKNFSEICEGLCEHMVEEDVVNFAAGTLRQWITEGIFSEYSV